MQSLFRFVADPSPCGYLPEQRWSLEYECVGALSAAEYLELMLAGWRRFGRMLFRPACRSCRACQPIRVLADSFRPTRSQRRCRQRNEETVRLQIGPPSVTRAKLALYDRYHAYQSDAHGWPRHPARDAASYTQSFVEQPFEVEEWCYYLADRLVGVGYVDCLPGLDAPAHPDRSQGGLSAIYFFYDPDQRHLSLGTWNVLSLLSEAAHRHLPFVYLGYFVAGCPSMTYKRLFQPHQILSPDGVWH